ncbi:hypothetical protein FG379_003350 [Cryptosporidium bovis]|uniref:uncharacterized protein n=1 Tax=Cryptosporidium bovis TaxID=310047 RepID=UPI00351A3B29|nr:hypothetical protein FG379_003350 [Cryptosporidium bovis]
MYINNTDNLGVTFHKIKVIATTSHVNFHCSWKKRELLPIQRINIDARMEVNILKFEGRTNKITTNWKVKVQKRENIHKYNN